MNLLKSKLMLRIGQSVLPANPREIYDKLKPFAASVGFTLTDKEIRFPQPVSFEQMAMLVSAYGEELYRETVSFDDIVAIESGNNKLHILLRTGHEFSFVKDRPFWVVYNRLNYGKPFFLTVWGWKLNEWWWKLKHWHTTTISNE